MRKAIRALLAAMVMVGMTSAGMAQTYPAPLSDTVSDFAEALAPETEARLSALLQAARGETGIHITLAVIDRQADYGGTGRLDAFAKGLFNAWGIGDPARNDGLLILVAMGDREARVALGSGYGPVWDGTAQRIIDRDLLPALRDGRAEEAVEATVRSAIEDIAQTRAAGQPPPDERRRTGIAGLDALILFLAALFGLFIWRGKRRIRAAKAGLATTAERPDAETAQAADRTSEGGFGGGRSDGGGASGKW